MWLALRLPDIGSLSRMRPQSSRDFFANSAKLYGFGTDAVRKHRDDSLNAFYAEIFRVASHIPELST
jgi:hypothetical protein